MERLVPNDGVLRLSSRSQRIPPGSFDLNTVWKLAVIILFSSMVYKIILSPSKQRHFPTWAALEYTLLTRVFGATDTPDLKTKLDNSWKDLFRPIEQMFLSDGGATAAIAKANVLSSASSFVTFATNTTHMQRWELSAGLRIVTPDSPNQSGVVEASFQSIVRDFGACITIPLLYGNDFLDRSPQLLADFWEFDNYIFPLMMIGIPSWAPFKTIKNGIAARTRVADAIEALYQRIDQYQRGQPINYNADMSDISTAALERSKVYVREDWTFRQRGQGDFAILFGQNANTHPMLFWFLTYVYSTPGLLQQLREETAPYVKVSQSSPPPDSSMDVTALSRNCPLMKSCIFETYRLATDAASIRYVARPITIKDGVYQHELKPGMYISVAHSVNQRDPSIYQNPDKFTPDRFLQVDPKTGKPVARRGALRPWGAGAAMCKGRTFAEKEIIALGTAIFSLWNITPASGTWKLPAMVPGTGVKKPVEDIRVRITRRILP
ncbi:uncharacterized protein KY384_006704 [Bacidia gigantensis]|uniref:uncharacterized protein n=1 Tax=Bacidia gigantensis TaxID=2732470 RepID=UPI001D0501E0|nr:uncharacterized protein KY384_006704 [Bacidia gigantensis]KAG8529015.1 hypothetical protein KY384_006704 [Bacidia gigantensis]